MSSYKGNTVTAIKNNKNWYRIGDEFPVFGERISPCKCENKRLIDIGQRVPRHWDGQCEDCKGRFNTLDGIAWHTAKDFAIFNTDLSSTTYEDIMELELENA